MHQVAGKFLFLRFELFNVQTLRARNLWLFTSRHRFLPLFFLAHAHEADVLSYYHHLATFIALPGTAALEIVLLSPAIQKVRILIYGPLPHVPFPRRIDRRNGKARLCDFGDLTALGSAEGRGDDIPTMLVLDQPTVENLVVRIPDSQSVEVALVNELQPALVMSKDGRIRITYETL